MSKVAIQGNASGTGTFTIAAPNSNTDRTLTLPDEAGTVLTSAGAGTDYLTPTGDGSALTGIAQDWAIVSSGTISSTTTIVFDTSNFDGTYHSHTIILELEMPSGSYNGGEVRLEFSADNGSSYLTGVVSYATYMSHSGWASNTTQTQQTRGGNYILIGHDGLINKAGQYRMDWLGLNRASTYKTVTYQTAKPNHDVSPQNLNGIHGIGGVDTSTSSNHAIRITHSGGASMQGTYRIYGRL